MGPVPVLCSGATGLRLPCLGLRHLTLALPCQVLLLVLWSRSNCTVSSFLPWLTFSSLVPALHLQPLYPHPAVAAPDKCQQLAGPKAQLWSLSREGLGCSSSQGGHNSCKSLGHSSSEMPKAGMQYEKMTQGQEQELHRGVVFRAKELEAA